MKISELLLLGINRMRRFSVPFIILGTILVLLAWLEPLGVAKKAESLLIVFAQPVALMAFLTLTLFLSGLALAALGPRSDESHRLKKHIYEHLVDQPVEILSSITAAIVWTMLPIFVFYSVQYRWEAAALVAFYTAQLIFIHFCALFVGSSTTDKTFQECRHRALVGHLLGVVSFLGAVGIFWLLPVPTHG